MIELRTDRFKLFDVFPEKAKKLAKSLHKKADQIEFVRKGIPIEPTDIKIEDGERAAIRLITTPRLDRDNEILIPEGAILDDFRQSPTVLYAHDYKGLPIGRDQWLKVTKRGILAKTQYATHNFAEDVYQCVKGGFLNSNSVGFIPLDAVNADDKKRFGELQDILEKDYGVLKEESGKAKNIYTKWILLEHSDVPVASNAQSLNIAVSKGELPITSDRLKKDLGIEIEPEPEQIGRGITTSGGSFVPSESITTDSISFKDDELKFDIESDVPEFQETDESEVIVPLELSEEGKQRIMEKVEKFNIEHKPETTENYHRIPVEDSGKHKDHRIRTITISASKGIKALYCGECKKVLTYLFDVDKWTMEEAQAWVKDHKDTTIIVDELEVTNKIFRERWNKSLSKRFDIESVDAPAATWQLDLFTKYLECEVKNIFQNNYLIPCPLLGTYLSAIEKICAKDTLIDTRNFTYEGRECPPEFEVIQLNSTKSGDFLIEGTKFYGIGDKNYIIKMQPTWFGINFSVVTRNTDREWNKSLMGKIHSWVKDNNYLRNETFALNGEFLSKTDDTWDSLILSPSAKDTLEKSAAHFKKQKENMLGRGLMFVGPPGTGKTKTGRVFLNDSGATFIWVSSRDFKKVDPVNALSLAFSLARDLIPSILFIEDIDTWLKDYTVDLLKTELDGLRQNKGILTVLTSNTPEKLPDTLLDRPGRFHHIVNFELPQKEQRREMLIRWAGKDIDESIINEIVGKTTGYSGAHMKELVDFAKILSEEENIELGEALGKSLKQLQAQRELIITLRAGQKEMDSIITLPPGSYEPKELVFKIEEAIKKYGESQMSLIVDLQAQVIELKAGRILPPESREQIQKCLEEMRHTADRLEELYEAVEPGAKEAKAEEKKPDEPDIHFDQPKENDGVDLERAVARALEKCLKPEFLSDIVKEAVEIKIKHLQGRVE